MDRDADVSRLARVNTVVRIDGTGFSETLALAGLEGAGAAVANATKPIRQRRWTRRHAADKR